MFWCTVWRLHRTVLDSHIWWAHRLLLVEKERKLQIATSPHKNRMNQLIRPSIPLTRPHLPTLCWGIGHVPHGFWWGHPLRLCCWWCVCARAQLQVLAEARDNQQVCLLLALFLRQSFTEPRAQWLARQDYQQVPSIPLYLKSCPYIYVTCTLPTKPSPHSQH